MNQKSNIQRKFLRAAIEIVGGQQVMAEIIGVSQQTISYWITCKNGIVPAEVARSIEVATGGRITRVDLRPDLFGDVKLGVHVVNSGTIPPAGHAEKKAAAPYAAQEGV